MKPEKITVRDAFGPVSFPGAILVDMSWNAETAAQRTAQTRRPPRWTDMVLYRVDDDQSPYQYVLMVVGRSIVYHRVDGCGRGTPTTVGYLARTPQWEEYEPCRECRPPELGPLDDNVRVSLEDDRPKLHRCETVEDLLAALVDRRTGEVSGLGIKLLNQAALLDPNIRATTEVERPL